VTRLCMWTHPGSLYMDQSSSVGMKLGGRDEGSFLGMVVQTNLYLKMGVGG
jgi:hypothetical protein